MKSKMACRSKPVFFLLTSTALLCHHITLSDNVPLESSSSSSSSSSSLSSSSTANINTVEPWPPATNPQATVQDLHREYSNIFPYGNRNAASHKWSTFLLDRASQMMSIETLEYFFSGFCSVSGSPVRPSNYNRYRLTLPYVPSSSKSKSSVLRQNQNSQNGNNDNHRKKKINNKKQRMVTGYMHYCCWPCVCDTQDFIRVDTLNVTIGTGETFTKHFAVIGNPCDHPEQLTTEFVQPYGRQRTVTLAQTAPELQCINNNNNNNSDLNNGGTSTSTSASTLQGATLSDNGYIIIGMFFDAVVGEDEDVFTPFTEARDGRISEAPNQVLYQDEREWMTHCRLRAARGYNSGMGEIFRQVSAISPIPEQEEDDEEYIDNDEGENNEEPSCASTTTSSTIQ